MKAHEEEFERFMFEQYGVSELPADRYVLVTINLKKVHDVRLHIWKSALEIGRQKGIDEAADVSCSLMTVAGSQEYLDGVSDCQILLKGCILKLKENKSHE